ncbi:hypothetical protein GASATCC11434_0034 [Streptococcus pyogenes]|nr:hypothetical protein GASATCC11434_0034 [Streptococcus pyogenes]
MLHRKLLPFQSLAGVCGTLQGWRTKATKKEARDELLLLQID